MKMKNIRSSIILFSLIFSSPVFADTCDDMSSLDWLVGSWQAKSGKSLISESWEKVDDKNLIGSSTTKRLNDSNPPFVETLRIVEMSESVFYLAKTPQNKLPIAFKLVSCEKDSLKFENLEHDFPNYLNYQKQSPDSFIAAVSDKSGKGFQINYQRIKESNQFDIINKYIKAYNAKKLDEMMLLVADSVQWMSVNGQSITVETANKKALKTAMEKYFGGKLTTRSEVYGLVKNGKYVSGIEKASWENNGKIFAQCAPVVYQIENEKIKSVWYFPAESCDS